MHLSSFTVVLLFGLSSLVLGGPVKRQAGSSDALTSTLTSTDGDAGFCYYGPCPGRGGDSSRNTTALYNDIPSPKGGSDVWQIGPITTTSTATNGTSEATNTSTTSSGPDSVISAFRADTWYYSD